MANILIVDDEVGIRELLSDILADFGHTVATAANAAAAQLAVQQTFFDLILLDIWMPDMDGVTLLKQFKTDSSFKSQVVMMSGHASIETAVAATKVGAYACLEKPFSSERLLDTIDKALVAGRRFIAMEKYRPKEVVAKPPKTPPAPVDLPRFEVPGTGVVIDFKESLRQVREATERAYLMTLIMHESCQITRVAQHAGLERTHLYRKLKALQMEIPRMPHVAKDTSKP